jgi:hypothetical protein
MKGVWDGSCHCGAVKFRVETDAVETASCDCSLCRRKNALMVQVHESGLTILEGEDQLALYQWNTGVARHYFCSRCGIYPFHRKRSAPDSYGVNVFCLEGFDHTAIPHRFAQGKTMTVETDDPRPEWSGPRV